jgi:hypothetical protein
VLARTCPSARISFSRGPSVRRRTRAVHRNRALDEAVREARDDRALRRVADEQERVEVAVADVPDHRRGDPGLRDVRLRLEHEVRQA